MFNFLKHKSTQGKSSVLSNQHPRKRRSKTLGPSKSGLPLAVKIALLCLVVSLSWFLAVEFHKVYSNTLANVLSWSYLNPKQWNIQIIDIQGTPLTDDLRKEVFKRVSSTVRVASPAALQSARSSVESMGRLQNISVVRPKYDTLVISATIRTPVLLVAVGSKNMLLSADGTVYGDATSDEFASQASALTSTLYGIFDKRASPIQYDKSQRVITTQDEGALLRAACDLFSQLVKQSFAVKSISYVDYRGFSAVVDDDTEIVLGSIPFHDKIDKLSSIYSKLKAQGTTAARIELDYDGKAFVKEKKM